MIKLSNKEFMLVDMFLCISIFFVFILICLIPNFINFYENKMYPAYMSHVANCPGEMSEINVTEFLKERGYMVVAEVNVSTSEVTYFETTPDIKTIKHEFIHINQKSRGASMSCFFPIDYLHELEAYVGQDLSDEKFIEIYGNYSYLK
jgi:hypothetical protein